MTRRDNRRPMGNYITIDAPGLRRRNRDLQEQVGQVLTQQLVKLLNLGPRSSALVVGLGNWNATPDALRPRERKGLNRNTLGVLVVAIGGPNSQRSTVVKGYRVNSEMTVKVGENGREAFTAGVRLSCVS